MLLKGWFPEVVRSSSDSKLVSLVADNANGQKQCLRHYLSPNQRLAVVVCLFFLIKKKIVLSKLYSQCGAQSHDLEIKSQTLCGLSQPGAPIVF